MKRIERLLIKMEETICVFLFLTVVLVVVWSVIARYLLRIPFISGEELARYLMIFCVFFGTSLGVHRKAHIGVEVLVQALKGRAKRAILLTSKFLSFIMFVILFVLSSIMVMSLIDAGQTTTITNIPMAIVFSCLPINMLLSSVHSFSNLIEEIKNGEGVPQA